MVVKISKNKFGRKRGIRKEGEHEEELLRQVNDLIRTSRMILIRGKNQT